MAEVSKRGRKAAAGKYPALVPAPVEDDEKPAAVEAVSLLCPKHLDETGQIIWERIVASLARLKILDDADFLQLEVLCDSYSRWRMARDFINALEVDRFGKVKQPERRNGETYEVNGRNGTQHKKRPQVEIMHECERRIMQIGSNFGLSPAAREHLKSLAMGGGEDDPDGLFA